MHYLAASKIIFGAEVSLTMTGTNSPKDLQVDGQKAEGKITIQNRYILNGSFFSGVALNPKVAVYGKIGFETNKFDLNYTHLTYQTPSQEKYSSSFRGLVPGIGTFYKLTQNLLFGGEYCYSLMKKRVVRSQDLTKKSANRGYTFSPSEHRVVGRITYLF